MLAAALLQLNPNARTAPVLPPENMPKVTMSSYHSHKNSLLGSSGVEALHRSSCKVQHATSQ